MYVPKREQQNGKECTWYSHRSPDIRQREGRVSDRIEIRDGREYRVTVLSSNPKPRCFICKQEREPSEIVGSGERRGIPWYLCEECAAKGM